MTIHDGCGDMHVGRWWQQWAVLLVTDQSGSVSTESLLLTLSVSSHCTLQLEVESPAQPGNDAFWSPCTLLIAVWYAYGQ